MQCRSNTGGGSGRTHGSKAVKTFGPGSGWGQRRLQSRETISWVGEHDPLVAFVVWLDSMASKKHLNLMPYPSPPQLRLDPQLALDSPLGPAFPFIPGNPGSPGGPALPGVPMKPGSPFMPGKGQRKTSQVLTWW